MDRNLRPHYFTLQIQQHTIESEEKKYNMGFSTPEELEVFTLQDVHQKFYET